MQQIAKENLDLIGIGLLTLAISAIALGFPDWQSPARIVLAFLFLLFAPGYVLMTALFPKRGDLDGVERLVLSLGLSVVVIPLLGLLLNYLPWGIRLAPMAVALALFIACSAAVVLYRRRQLAPAEHFTIRVESVAFRHYAQLFVMVGVAFALVVVAAQALRPEPLATEFYVLGPEGRLEGYPTALTPGERATLTFGVSNHEGRTVTYRIHAPFVTEEPVAITPPLEDGERWEATVEFDAPAGSGRTELIFELYRSGDSEPYRSLRLFVTLTVSPQEHAVAALLPVCQPKPWPS